MPKNTVDEWDATAGNNTDVGGINIDEGMSPGDVNNAIREMMAQLKTNQSTLLPTGVALSYSGTSAPTGWLLLNGDTLGSAASTATQKSDDYQTLFELLWDSMADAEAPVDGGRGASANADWTANKKITMPDARGKSAFGLEATATLLTSAVAGFDGDVLGKTGGDQLLHNHQHGLPGNTGRSISSGGADVVVEIGGAQVGSSILAGGGGSNNVPPAIVLNWIIKI